MLGDLTIIAKEALAIQKDIPALLRNSLQLKQNSDLIYSLINYIEEKKLIDSPELKKQIENIKKLNLENMIAITEIAEVMQPLIYKYNKEENKTGEE